LNLKTTLRSVHNFIINDLPSVLILKIADKVSSDFS